VLIVVAAAVHMGMLAGTAPLPRGNIDQWVLPSDYPTAHPPRRETVTVRLDVGSDGRVTGCSIVESSGSAPFDVTACLRLRQRARFDPARDAQGKAIAGQWSMRVRWAEPR
jgi:periplasmic protein TonB